MLHDRRIPRTRANIDHLVRDALEGVPVVGALYFVAADWPLFGGAFVTRGVHVLWPKRLAKLLTSTHSDDDGEPVDVPATYARLAAAFPPS